MKTQKEQMQKMKEIQEELQKKSVESTYIQQATSNTYLLQKEKIYLVAISSIANGDATSMNAWLVSTGRNNENAGFVQRLVGENYGCTIDGLELTVTHNYYSLVSVTEL